MSSGRDRRDGYYLDMLREIGVQIHRAKGNNAQRKANKYTRDLDRAFTAVVNALKTSRAVIRRGRNAVYESPYNT